MVSWVWWKILKVEGGCPNQINKKATHWTTLHIYMWGKKTANLLWEWWTQGLFKRFSRMPSFEYLIGRHTAAGGTVTWALLYSKLSGQNPWKSREHSPWCGRKGDDRRQLDFSEEVGLAFILETSHVYFLPWVWPIFNWAGRCIIKRLNYYSYIDFGIFLNYFRRKW